MANTTYGLDFGTYDLKIYDHKKNKIWKLKNAIAIKDGKNIFAAGDAAYAMHEKTPDFIQVSFPMRSGVVADFELMQKFLQILFSAQGYRMIAGNYIIAVPSNITEVEKRAFVELMGYSRVKIQSAKIVERGLAAAIGLGIPVLEENGVFIVDLGGESCELSVISQGKSVLTRRLETGGSQMDKAIVNEIRRQHEFLIGQPTAEHVRKHFGILDSFHKDDIMIAGRDLCSGLPKMKPVSADTIHNTLEEILDNYINAIQMMLKRIPPDIRRQVNHTGVFLCGGVANMEGLQDYFEERLQCKIIAEEQSELCVVKGLREIINDPKYEKMTYSMSDENYRWLR